MFNVGEVVTLPDGSVKSKEALAILEQRKAEKEAEKAAKEALGPGQEPPKKGKMSKRQQQKQAALQPRPPPPRPVLPEGICLPEGEENWIAMWDITDEEIKKRLSEDKRRKSIARKNLRREQKAQKKINKAMKILKRQTENRGEKWDPVEGRKIVMKQQEEDSSEEDSQDSGEDGDSENESPEAVFAQVEGVVEVAQPVELPKSDKEPEHSKRVNKAHEITSKVCIAEPLAGTQEYELKKVKRSKRSAEDSLVEEPKAKKSKMSQKPEKPDGAVGINKTSAITGSAHANAPNPETEDQEALEEKKRARAEKKRANKDSKRARNEKKAQEEAAKTGKAAGHSKKSKKRKHENDTEYGTMDNEKPRKKDKRTMDPAENLDDLPSLKDKQDRYYTNFTKSDELPTKESKVASQWNPDALTGEAARKDKFLRLLGAGKASAKAPDAMRYKSTAKAVDISKVESELERQYEAGMKMKHDGGGKRKGLGA
jgi:hypothetical protein